MRPVADCARNLARFPKETAMHPSKLMWSLMALAPCLASAQSSVSVYGVVDMAISSYHGTGAGSKQMLTSSGNQASRIGFKGQEILGNGLSAGFELEAGLNTDSGTGQPTSADNQKNTDSGGGLTFNRKAYVYLQNNDWGQLRLGRDYTPAFWNLFAYDPFRVGVGISSQVVYGTTATGFRASNSIGYFSPGCYSFQCKGAFFQGMVAFGENGGNAPSRHDGDLHAFRLGYGGENFDVAIASATTKSAAYGDYIQRNIGASYLWQGHRLMGLLGQNRTSNLVNFKDGGSANRINFWQLGAWISTGPGKGYFPVSYMQLRRNDVQGASSARKFAVGYVHPLSKRTVLYGTYAHISNKGALRFPVSSGSAQGPEPVAGGNASGVDLGIRHIF